MVLVSLVGLMFFFYMIGHVLLPSFPGLFALLHAGAASGLGKAHSEQVQDGPASSVQSSQDLRPGLFILLQLKCKNAGIVGQYAEKCRHIPLLVLG